MTALATATPGVRIAMVKVGERARRDYGDLETLKASIREHGLLQPIVLLPGDYLLCGGRRLEACKQLGWDSIPAVWSSTQTDAISRLKAERDENTCRKEMTPSELVAIGLKLEELKRPEAVERQGKRTDLTSGPDDPEVTHGHTTRREVAEAVGMTESTYKRAKRVVEAAEDPGEDPEVKKVAVEARALMDAGKLSISAADRKVAEAQQAAEQAAAPTGRVWVPQEQRIEQIRRLAETGHTSGQIGAEIGIGEEWVKKLAKSNAITIAADAVVRHTRRVDSARVVRTTVLDASNLISPGLIGQVDFAALPREHLGEWISSLSESIKALRSLKSSLEKELHRG